MLFLAKKTLKTILLTCLMFVLVFSSASASISRHIKRGDDGKFYEFALSDVRSAYVNYVLSANEHSKDTVVFERYTQLGEIVSVYHEKAGYVDVSDLRREYASFVLTPEDQRESNRFDLDSYIETRAKSAEIEGLIIDVSVDEEKGLVEEIKEDVSELLGNRLIKEFKTSPSFEVGKLLVAVEIRVEDPSEYEVHVKDIKLNYDANQQFFYGDVDEEDAKRVNVKIEKKEPVIPPRLSINQTSFELQEGEELSVEIETIYEGQDQLSYRLISTNPDVAFLEKQDEDYKLFALKEGKVEIGIMVVNSEGKRAVVRIQVEVLGAPPVPAIERFISNPALATLGNSFVVVIIDTDEPENYTVSIGEFVLNFADGAFTGEVSLNLAKEENVVVTRK